MLHAYLVLLELPFPLFVLLLPSIESISLPLFPFLVRNCSFVLSKRDINVSIDQITLERLNSYEPI